MAAVANGNVKRYSWWWDSHNTPKNSKWLQENLTDMDSKVKQMIKVIEEDADSFARRAEMYYKKRPELMKLVEEFYRAYRALAERYDHATGVIRHAQQTMAEVFPNQDPMMFGEESPLGSSTDDYDPQTPDSYPPIRAPIYPNEFKKDALGGAFSHMSTVKRNIAFMEEPHSMSNGKGFQTGKARKGLNFNAVDGRNAKVLSESERASKAEAEIVALKDALSKVQAEKEANLAQFDQNLERLTYLESEVSRAQDDSKGLIERAKTAEAEVEALRESLSKLEVEKGSSLLQYQQCLQNIADLEDRISLAQKEAGEVDERASRAEAETLALKQSLARSETDKDTALVQYQQCLETISNLEERLGKAEEDAKLDNQRAENAEDEVESLKQRVSKLIEENEAYELQYQQCLDTIADLKLKLFHAQEETKRLSREIEDGVAKLKFAEEKCVILERSNQDLHSELDGLLEKLGDQSHELTEKQKEMGRLWTSVQEEHLRFMEAETAFQTLQQLHSQSQEELSTLALELQNRSQILKDMEARNNGLQEEVQEAKDANKSLSELNLSSAASIKSLQEEVSRLRETIQKLETEVELRVDQRNALQQEIYALKEELSQIGKKHQSMVEQVKLVGLHPEDFEFSVKQLQEENSKLKEIKERESIEKTALLEKLEKMEKLVQKNFLLENSISDLNAELETIRGKLKTLEEACMSLTKEKSSLHSEKDMLISRLQNATENSKKLSEENRVLEDSLYNTNAELEDIKSKLKSLEESCHMMSDENSGLTSEKESLLSEMEIMRKRIKDLEKEQAELEMKVSDLARQRESSLQKIEELGVSLDAKDREYVRFVQFSESKMNGMESKILHLQDENQCREREYQVELDRAHDFHVEILVLQKCLQDWVEKSSSLIAENQNIKGASLLSEKLVSELKLENSGKQVQIDSSINCLKILRTGIYQVLMKLEINPGTDSSDDDSQDQKNLQDILNKLDDMQTMLSKSGDENQHSAIENLVLVEFLRQLKSKAIGIETEKKILEKELESQSHQLSFSRDETQKLVLMNGELTTKVDQVVNREEVLKVDIENLQRQVLQFRDDYTTLQGENCKTLDEKAYLTKSALRLEEEKHVLEEDISLLLSETIYQSNLITLLEEVVLEKLSGAVKLTEDLDRLSLVKCKLEEEVRQVSDKLKSTEIEKSQLEGLLERSNAELLSTRSANDQLQHEIADVKDQLDHEIANVKDQLDQKDKELLEAMLMIMIFQNDRSELCKAVEGLECRYKEAKAIEEFKDNQILKLREDYDEQAKTNGDKLKSTEIEKFQLEGLLKISNAELLSARSANDQLEHEIADVKDQLDREIANVKDQLDQKDEKLLEAMLMTTIFQNERSELCKAVEGLERRYKEAKAIEESKDNHILKIRGDYDEQVKTNSDKLKSAEIEKSQLEGLLERSNAELLSAKSANDELEREIANVKDQLDQKDTKVLEAMLMITIFQNERSDICKAVEGLECRYKEAQEIEEYKDNQILKLRGDYDEQVKTNSDMLKSAEIEKSQFEGLLERSNAELLSARLANDQLEHEIADVKDELDQKDKELLEAMLMITIFQNERSELCKAVECLECKYKEAKAIEEYKDNQILKLRGDYDEQVKKNSDTSEANLKLEADLMSSLMELEEIKVKKEKLNQELVTEKNKIELWESQSATLFGDLQISTVHETLLEGLTHELAEACKNLESRSTLKDMEIDQLKGRVNNLDDANKRQNDLMSKYGQAIFLLKESIASLEKHTAMPHEFENEPATDTASVVDNNNGFLEMQELCMRIKAIEEAVTKKFAMEELRNSSARRSRRRNGSLRKQNHDIYSEESEMITKDIVLDQVSDCSSYGISKREISRLEDDHSLKPQNSQKGKSLSEESLVVDKLEISDRFTDPNKDINKRKVLERLHSDLQKLSNLHIVVEDMKTKVETEEKGEKGKEDEYETIKGQINEAEEALEKLLSINRKLVTKVQSGFERSDGSKSSMDLDENESSRRRRISEQARRTSEKIGRLQLETQRLQFLLLKLGERENGAKAKISDSKTRTLLRDYIYGGVRGERRKRIKRRFAFCGCVQQPPPSP